MRMLMLGAAFLLYVAMSCLGLYLIKAALYGTTPFVGDPTLRAVYLTVLGLHSLAATVNVPLVIVTLILGLKRKDVLHQRDKSLGIRYTQEDPSLCEHSALLFQGKESHAPIHHQNRIHTSLLFFLCISHSHKCL